MEDQVLDLLIGCRRRLLAILRVIRLQLETELSEVMEAAMAWLEREDTSSTSGAATSCLTRPRLILNESRFLVGSAWRQTFVSRGHLASRTTASPADGHEISVSLALPSLGANNAEAVVPASARKGKDRLKAGLRTSDAPRNGRTVSLHRRLCSECPPSSIPDSLSTTSLPCVVLPLMAGIACGDAVVGYVASFTGRAGLSNRLRAGTLCLENVRRIYRPKNPGDRHVG